MKKEYDYLIVGAGLFGSVFAYEMSSRGKSCLVIDKRNHVGGNCYTENIEGINVHMYGPHIFHTSNELVWKYMQRFCKFNNFINSPLASTEKGLVNLPFNMNTFYQLWGVSSPESAKEMIEKQRLKIDVPKNLEEQALSLVGSDIYNLLIKDYTEKQWGMSCKKLPPFIIKRLPVRFTFNNNYFNDTYQGIPIGGYTNVIQTMLRYSDLLLNTDYFELIKLNKYTFKKTVFTGEIDRFFGYKYGHLDYRTVYFEHKLLDTDNYQGNAVINYTSHSVPWTRIIEHKWFENADSKHSIISKEYSKKWEQGDEPFYPVNDDKNNKLYKQYLEEAKSRPDVIFAGRLGEYKYYDMDKTIENALKLAEEELQK